MASFEEMMNQATAMPVVPQANLAPTPLTQISDLLGGKQREVAAAAQSKKALMGADGVARAMPTEADQYRAAVGGMTQSGQATAGEVERDLQTLSPGEILQKYPQQGMSLLLGSATASSAVRRDATIERTPGEGIYDTATGVGLGLGNAIGGIGAFGLGLIDDGAGVAAANVIGEINESIQGSQSEALNARRRLIQTENQLDYRDSAAEAEADIAGGGSPIAAKVSRELRNMGNAIVNTAADPTSLGDLTASGAGSLLAAGPIGKVVGGGTKLLGAGAARTGLVTEGSATATKLAEAAQAIRIPTAIGAMEGGGAYQQAADEISKTPFSKLFAESPEFSSLVMQGMSPAEARTQIANRAGVIAGSIAAPLAAATGTLVSRFEGAPLSVASLRTAGSNILRETAEETVQSATGQLAQNTGIRDQANPNLDIAAGVGEQAGLGALGGLTSGAVVQAPGALVQGTLDVGNAITAGASFAGTKLMERGQRILAGNEAASPVADAKVQEAVATAAAVAPEAVQTVKAAVEAMPETAATPEQKGAAQEYIDELVGSARFDPDQFVEMPESIQAIVAGSTDKIDAIKRLTAAANQGGDDGVLAGRVINALLDGLSGTLLLEPEALQNLPDDHAAVDFIQKYRTLLRDMEQTPAVKAARVAVAKAAEGVVALVDANPLTAETDVTSLAGQRAVQAHISMLELAPEKLKPEAVDALLGHAEALGIPADRRKSLMVISETLKAARDEQARRAALGLRPRDWVNRQVLVDESGTNPNQKSVAEHAKGVRLAYGAGNRNEAAARLVDLMQFAEHMSNKVGAVNANVAGRDVNAQGQSFYRTLTSTAERAWRDGTDPIKIHRGNANSIRFAQELAVEAETVARVANALADAYPELGVGHFDVAPLTAELNGDADALAKQFRDQRMVVPSQSTPVVVEEAPVTEPTAEAANATVEPTPQPVEKKADVTPVVEEAEVREKPADTIVTEAASVSDTSDKGKVEVPTDPVESVEDKPVSSQVAGESDVPPPSEQKGMSMVFPDLAGTVRNFFLEGFRPRAEESSRLLRTESPIGMVEDALSNDTALASLTGSTAKRTLTKEVVEAYRDDVFGALPGVLNQMTYALRTALGKAPKTGANAGRTLGERLAAGEDVTHFPNTKTLNLVEPREEGFEYNQQLAEGAALAGMQWAIVSASTKQLIEPEDVASQLNISEDDVSADLLTLMRSGASTLETLQAIASKIENYWGMTTNNDAGTGMTEGIPMAMATEVLTALVKEGLVVQTTFRVTPDGTILAADEKAGKGVVAPEVNRYKAAPELFANDALFEFPNAIDVAMLVKPTPVHYFGTDRPSVAPKQMRSRYVDNTPQQRAAIKANQEIPYFKNDTMASFFVDGLGLPAVLELLGNGDTDAKQWNAGHLKTVEGQNAALTDAFNYLTSMLAELDNAASTAGVPADRHPIHYGFNMSKVGRLQMLGSYTPQSNKILREVIMPTRSVMDLSNENSFSMQAFRLAQAQALGIKVHQISREEMTRQLDTLMKGKLADVVDGLQAWQKIGGQVDPELVIQIKAALGGDMSAVALHALVEEAKLRNTTDRSKFETHLYVEADGVTNGPVNSMGLLSMGEFTPLFLQNMAKGGLFIGEPNKTMNIHREYDDSVDLYKATTNTLSETLALGLKANPPGTELGDQMRHLYKLMDLFFGKDLSFDTDTGVLKLDRGIAKNPLTITVYGSGEKGIANKMTQLLIEKIYERMSAAMQSEDGPIAQQMFPGPNADTDMQAYTTALDALINSTVGKVFGRMVVSNTPVDIRRSADQSAINNFQFDKKEFNNIARNMQFLFVGPMRDAISINTGESLEQATTLIRKATQVQSLFLAHEFQRLVNEKLAEKEKDPVYKKTEFLSQRELDEIYQQLQPLHPVISTGTQDFYIAGRQSVEKKRRPLAVSLDGDISTNQFVQGPADSGVAGIASLVIGTGDGNMMQIASSLPGVTDRTLPVFDGINLPLDNIERASRGMNEAVYQTWQGNPMKAVAEMFSGMLDGLSKNPFEDMDTKAEILNSIMDKKVDAATITPDQVMSALSALEAQLHAAAQDIDARHAVLSKVQASLDQMASVGAPYQTPGATVVAGTNEEKAAALNDLLAVERASLKPVALKTRTYGALPSQTEFSGEFETVDPETEVIEAQPEPKPIMATLPELPSSKNVWDVDISDDLAAIGQADGDVRIGDVTDINKLLRRAKKNAATRAEGEIIGEMVRSLSADGWRMVTGEPAAVLSWFRAEGMPVYEPTPEELATGNLAGFSDAQHKIIAVMNGTLETTLHELIHASVSDSVNAFYNGGTVSFPTRAALTNIEGLMEDFLALPTNKLGNDMQVIATYEHAKATIERDLALGNQASALNEFMAWGLANRKLGEIQKVNTISPLGRISQFIYNAIRKLVWGRKVAPTAPGNDMLSNLLFNTAVVMRQQAEGTTLQAQVAPLVQAHNAMYGQDQRLESVKQTFKQVIVDQVNEKFDKGVKLSPAQEAVRRAETAALMKDNDTMLTFAAVGLLRTAQERDTFNMVVSALGTEARIDGNALTRANQLYDHAIKELTVEDFMENPDVNHPADRYQAQKQYNALMGLYGVKHDSSGRSTLLPSFVALAMTSEKFRTTLTNMSAPKNTPKNWGTADGVLEAIGNHVMEELGKRMSGQGNSTNVMGQLDSLIDHITDEVSKQNSQFEDYYSKAGGFLENVNEKTRMALETLSIAVVDKANAIRAKTNLKPVQFAANTAAIIASLGSEAKGEEVARGLQEGINKMKLWRPLFNLMTDMIGRTLDNAEVYDKIKKVRAFVQQVRQGYVQHVPTVIASKFTRHLEDDEWTTLHNGIAKTDLAALVATGMGLNKVMNLVEDDAARAAEIAKLEADIKQLDAANASLLLKKTKQLADFMVGGTPGVNLLRNANAVASLFGETVARGTPKPSKALIRTVDHLASLYALDQQETVDLTALSSLVRNEPEGVSFVLSYLVGQRAEEQRKAEASPKARYNQYKGYIPANQSEGVHLIVADDSEFASLTERSYKRVGDYEGSTIDPTKTKRGYYFSATPNRGTFNQGILQNVRTTANGVDAATGFTLGMTAGRIQDRQLVASIFRNMGKEKGSENLLPVYNDQGLPVAYERSIDPDQLEQLDHNTHLAKNIGIWRGRQAEEQAGQVYNEYLIDALHNVLMTDRQRGTEKGQYVDLFDKRALAKDPVLRDAVALMTPSTIELVKAKFGNEFLVRTDMLEDAMGYREASVGDAWTGTTRWSKKTQEQVKNLSIAVMGNEAYRYLVQGEKLLQNFVTDARVMIVVKSIVVPAANLVSNFYQLASRGVPLLSIVQGMPRKTAEVDAYVKTKLRAIEAEAELRAAEGNVILTRKLTAEIQSINDSHRRMSIWPLIEAGEFSSISDAGISRDEILLSEGRLHAYMEALVSKLPGAAQTVGRYAVITKDTALFQGLQKAVEYSDFLAKAILYDDLTMRKKMTKEQALGRVTEEFVNYDRLPGRFRGYLESTGLLWFYNFKIRSTKIALSMIRNNPVHALLAGLTPAPAGIGTPLSDNLFSKGLTGSLFDSIGVGQGFRAPMLNPWANLIF